MSKNEKNLVDVQHLVQEGSQSINHKKKKAPQLKNVETNSGLSADGSHVRSGKSNSESRQRAGAKAGANYGMPAPLSESSRMKQLNNK